MAVESRAQTLLVSHPHFKTSCLSPALTHHLLQEKITATASQMSPQDLHGKEREQKASWEVSLAFFLSSSPSPPGMSSPRGAELAPAGSNAAWHLSHMLQTYRMRSCC